MLPFCSLWGDQTLTFLFISLYPRDPHGSWHIVGAQSLILSEWEKEWVSSHQLIPERLMCPPACEEITKMNFLLALQELHLPASVPWLASNMALIICLLSSSQLTHFCTSFSMAHLFSAFLLPNTLWFLKSTFYD